LVSFVLLALLLPEAGKTHRGSQLPGFGLLAVSNGEGSRKTFLRLSCRLSQAQSWYRGTFLRKEEFSFQAVQFGLTPILPAPMHHRKRFGEQFLPSGFLPELPKLGGWKVLQTIRATPALARMPVVMLTGAAMEVDEVHRAALQPLAYFVKPILLREYQQLVHELEQLLDTIPCSG
jgi:hypothetical protein